MTKKFAFVFPGQGSQHLGMLNDLANLFPIIQEVFAEASDALGYNLWSLTQQGPDEQLNITEFTQPALLTAGVAVWRLWQTNKPPHPDYLAGHSLGEYTALVCSDALDFRDGVKLVAKRGKFMQAAVPAGIGAMAAIIGLDENTVKDVCERSSNLDEQVSSANYNSVGQIVIAGHIGAVDRAIVFAKDQGAKLAKKLPVSVPSHCKLMKPAALQLTEELMAVSVQAPKIPVINNVDVQCYQDAKEIKDALVRQLYSPVRWVETVQFFKTKQVSAIIESGPGKVLTGLNKRIAEDLDVIAINQPASLDEALSLIGGKNDT